MTSETSTDFHPRRGAESASGDGHTESRIALLVGGDLDEAERAEVERRVANCARARACRDEMQRSLEVLHACRDGADCRDGAAAEEHDAEIASLWPGLRSRLASCRPRRDSLEGLRPWVPAITVAALVLAIATVATNPPVRMGADPVVAGDEWGVRPETLPSGPALPPSRLGEARLIRPLPLAEQHGERFPADDVPAAVEDELSSREGSPRLPRHVDRLDALLRIQREFGEFGLRIR